ncbi:MAG: FAD-binding oxidoreductase, partial [Nocardioides sp.]
VPAQPARSTMVATFPDVQSAADSVVAIGSEIRASMMELMDATTIKAVENYRPMGLDRTAGALLLAQSDAPGQARTTEIAVMAEICGTHGATEVFVTDDPDEGDMFVQARRLVFPAVEARGTTMHEDVGVPVPRLPQLLVEVARLSAAYGVEIPVVAHAGDGNTHPIIVYDPAQAGAAERARQAFDEVMSAAIRLGGTITGEHGVGRAKKGKLAEQLGPDVMALNYRIKRALDPDGILNPGAIL